MKAAPGGDTTALDAIGDRPRPPALQGAVVGALDQVKADVAALKSAVESGSAGDGAAVQALNSKLAELQAAVAALGQGGQGVSQEAIDADQPEDRRSRRGGSGRRRDRQGRRGPACGARAKRRRPVGPGRQAGGAAEGGAGHRGGGAEVGDRARRAVHGRGRDVRGDRAGCAGTAGACATSPRRASPAAPIWSPRRTRPPTR